MSDTGITAPEGFAAAATTAGIKASGKPDMALVVNEGPDLTAAALFTRNRIVAAPVKISRANIADGRLKAVVYNSGNANACNGSRGEADATATIAPDRTMPAPSIPSLMSRMRGSMRLVANSE